MESKGGYLAEDVLIEILSRMSVKSLLQFRCVCKFWKNLIDSPAFISIHLQHNNNKDNAHLVVHYYDDNRDLWDIVLFPDKMLTVPTYHNMDLSFSAYNLVGGPINGIFCLCDKRERIGLWNPATRAFRALPLCRTKLFPRDWIPCHCGFGFGLDPTSDDYKVVWIRRFDDGEPAKWGPWMDPIHVAVYTLSTDSWKDFKGDAPDTYCLNSLIESCYDSYLNGVYYWWSTHGKLVLFDMGKEEFREIEGPPLIHQDSAYEILALYSGSIALIYSHSQVPLDSWESAEQSSVALWVLMEEEGMGYWIKQLNIGPLHGMMKPVGVWKNDEVFVETTPGHLLLYNPNTQRVLKDLQILGHRTHSCCLHLLIYTESLLSVHGKGEPGEYKNPSGVIKLPRSFF
ncbi:unnamed protein product [Ilex paraguariensis]|uniref:F-box domain-containing protein n=1 Tax=Ilex paraguariensis TaxID=185542 RepID=A0ABC8RKU5_9AQUA